MIESPQSVSTILSKYLMGWGDGMQNGNSSFDMNNYHIMQFTGLKDSKRTKEFPNGQDIYEGDLRKAEFANGTLVYECVYHEETASYLWNPLDNQDFAGLPEHAMSFEELEEVEVIGNIHDNPELLEDA